MYLASGSVHSISPSMMGLLIVVFILALSFVLVKWGGVKLWGAILFIIFGLILAETHLIGPHLAPLLSQYTNGILG